MAVSSVLRLSIEEAGSRCRIVAKSGQVEREIEIDILPNSLGRTYCPCKKPFCVAPVRAEVKQRGRRLPIIRRETWRRRLLTIRWCRKSARNCSTSSFNGKYWSAIAIRWPQDKMMNRCE